MNGVVFDPVEQAASCERVEAKGLFLTQRCDGMYVCRA